MTNEEKATKIAESLNKANGSVCLLPCHQASMAMAEWKDEQPQIIEIFGKRVKIVEDNGFQCAYCALKTECLWCVTNICKGLSEKGGRHFVECDQYGN